LKRTTFAGIAALAAVLALGVIMLGAYVRLSDAGLGCPDWPGCYGRLGAPSGEEAVSEANAAYPHRPVESAKAWKEMIHRYLASSLGVVIVVLAAVAWRNRKTLPVALPSLLVALVIFQGLLGMWTVTLLVKPAVVTAHLAGGLATLSLLWLLVLRHGGMFPPPAGSALAGLRAWVWGALALVCAQILLGGWTSTNYAALACTQFPTCYGDLWWPPTDFRDAFVVWRGLGVNYEFGVLDSAARTAIHLAHRIGALLVFLYVTMLAIQVMRRSQTATERRLGLALALAVWLQVGLGIANVLGHLPLPVAVAHNGGAALLLLTVVTLLYALRAKTTPTASNPDAAETSAARLSS